MCAQGREEEREKKRNLLLVYLMRASAHAFERRGDEESVGEKGSPPPLCARMGRGENKERRG